VRELERVGLRVRRWLERGLGSTWVVAVSGGSDSVGLLRVLHRLSPRLGLQLSVAHLDHGVRGEIGREEAGFVAGLAERLGLPADLGRWSPDRAGHFEVDARRARYDWLLKVAQARGAQVVAAGHTRDDQAETVLHRILRGTGVGGLAGIPSLRPLGEGIMLVRPLLKVTRAELRAELARLGQPFREDASNTDTTRTRARIRHELIPHLAAEYNPKVAEALVRLGELAGAADRVLKRRVRALAQSLTMDRTETRIVLDRQGLQSLSGYLRAEALRWVWRDAGWPERAMSAERWRKLARVAGSRSATTSFNGDWAGVHLNIDEKSLVLSIDPSLDTRRVEPGGSLEPIEPPRQPLTLELPGSICWRRGRVVASLDPMRRSDEVLDLDALHPPLAVRQARPGDRFHPLGMSGHGTPLNDFFRGRKVARGERANIPLVLDQEGIIWVVGHRIAERVRRTEATARTVGLSWEPEVTPDLEPGHEA